MNAKSFYVAVAVRQAQVQQVRKVLQGHKGQEAAQGLWGIQGILALRVMRVAQGYLAHLGRRVSPAKTEPPARQAPWAPKAKEGYKARKASKELWGQLVQKEELDQPAHKGFKVSLV